MAKLKGLNSQQISAVASSMAQAHKIESLGSQITCTCGSASSSFDALMSFEDQIAFMIIHSVKDALRTTGPIIEITKESNA